MCLTFLFQKFIRKSENFFITLCKDLTWAFRIRYIKTERLAQTLIYGGPPFVPNIEDFFLFFEPFQIRTLLLVKPHLLVSTWRCVKFNETKTNNFTKLQSVVIDGSKFSHAEFYLHCQSEVLFPDLVEQFYVLHLEYFFSSRPIDY